MTVSEWPCSGQFGLTWPWESLHVEALAWFDQWLKDRDTGILDGPPIRYWLPVADEWRASDTWPPPGFPLRELDPLRRRSLGEGGQTTGSREYLTLGTGLNRAQVSPTDPPAFLTWTTDPLDQVWDVVGNMELLLDAQSTAIDTAWILTLQDVAPDGTTVDITAGFLRAAFRAGGQGGEPARGADADMWTARGSPHRRNSVLPNPSRPERPPHRDWAPPPARPHQ